MLEVETTARRNFSNVVVCKRKVQWGKLCETNVVIGITESDVSNMIYLVDCLINSNFAGLIFYSSVLRLILNLFSSYSDIGGNGRFEADKISCRK